MRYGPGQTCRDSRGLSGIFLLTCGTALWLSLHTTITLGVFSAMTLLARQQRLQPSLNPERILIPAFTVIVARLALMQVSPQAGVPSAADSPSHMDAPVALSHLPNRYHAFPGSRFESPSL